MFAEIAEETEKVRVNPLTKGFQSSEVEKNDGVNKAVKEDVAGPEGKRGNRMERS